MELSVQKSDKFARDPGDINRGNASDEGEEVYRDASCCKHKQ